MKKEIDLGMKIATIRKGRGWTQAEFAGQIHVTQSHVSGIETGRFSPSLELFHKIVTALDCKPDELMGMHKAKTAEEQLSRSRADSMIVVEQEEGRKKTRFILPPTRESYAFIRKQLFRSEDDPRLEAVFKVWDEATEEQKENALRILGNQRKKSEERV